MDEFRWFKISLLLFTVGLNWTTGQSTYRIYVRDGDEATLSCEHVKNDQKECDSIDWLFADPGFKRAVRLTEGGQIGENAEHKSDRLSVMKNCSLVVKHVSAEDAGHYTCRLQGRNETHVYLFLTTMTEVKNAETVTLFCDVWPCINNEHSVKWVYEDEDDEENKPKETSLCSVSVTFLTSHAKEKAKYREVFKCEVTDHRTEEVHNFTFRPQSSDEEETTTTTTPLTTKNSNKRSNSTGPTIKEEVIVARDLLALVIIIVLVIRWKRTKGKKTKKDENTADPEDGDSYTNISYIKKTRKARVKK